MLAKFATAIFLLAGLAAAADNPADTVHFHLFTRSSQQGSAVGEEFDPKLPVLDGEKPLVLIIHGFGGSAKAKSSLIIKDALLSTMDCIVFLVDWGTLARSDEGYEEAVRNVVPAGREVASFLGTLLALPGLDRRNVTLVGFSLGAHVAGVAAAHLGPDKLGTIIALDAAGPMYKNRSREEMLDSKDAEFVWAVHTSGDFLGINSSIGHADFYPNGGQSPQPSCASSEVSQVCSHYMSVLLFVQSVYDPTAFLATRCHSWSDFLANKCRRYREQMIYMGLETPRTARGKFFLTTKDVPPYGNVSADRRAVTQLPEDLMVDEFLPDEVYDVAEDVSSVAEGSAVGVVVSSAAISSSLSSAMMLFLLR